MYKHLFIVGIITLSIMILGGCGSSPKPNDPYTVKIPENMSDSFKKGMEDGCSTAKGEYTKISDLFNSDEDYKNGWFAGRSRCNPSNQKD